MSPIIVGAIIAAAAAIIAAVIQNSRKNEDSNNPLGKNTNISPVQSLTVNVNIGDEDTPVEQTSMAVDRATSVGQRRRNNPFLPNQDEIKNADIKDPHYFETIATYLAENRSLDQIKIKGDKE